MNRGSQFTSSAFTNVLVQGEIKFNMDGKGAWRDNVLLFGLAAPTNIIQTSRPDENLVGLSFFDVVKGRPSAQ